MMPEWHQLDSSSTMPQQQESTKKKNFKIKFHVNLVFYRTKLFKSGSEMTQAMESLTLAGVPT